MRSTASIDADAGVAVDLHDELTAVIQGLDRIRSDMLSLSNSLIRIRNHLNGLDTSRGDIDRLLQQWRHDDD